MLVSGDERTDMPRDAKPTIAELRKKLTQARKASTDAQTQVPALPQSELLRLKTRAYKIWQELEKKTIEGKQDK